MDKISEANELFDAVLTGSVDKEKKVSSKTASTKKASEFGKTTDEKKHKKQKMTRKLSIYVGNFPWVSPTPFFFSLVILKNSG